MNIKRFSVVFMLCSCSLVSYAEQSFEDEVKFQNNATFEGLTTMNGYLNMNDGGSAKKSFSIYTGGDIDINQNIYISGRETSYGTVIPTVESVSKFASLTPLNFRSSDFHFIGGPVYLDSTFTVSGESYLQSTLSVYPIKGAPYSVKIKEEGSVPVISFEQKSGAYKGKIRSSSFDFVGGPVSFDSAVTVNGRCRVYDELYVSPSDGAPLGISLMSGEDYTPTISFRGLYNSIQRGSIQASKLFIDGKVGIGTNEVSDNVQLQVAGKILCTGDIEVASIDASDIKTNDITVKMNDVADYVFEEGYDLKNLSEVEAYVNANKHLPGIPSAAEIEKDGVSLSKMTNLLLEKVEELTLHMIQLEKENKALKAEMQNMKK